MFFHVYIICLYLPVYNTNVKNMHPHRDSNPGPWNTVPIVVFRYVCLHVSNVNMFACMQNI